LEFVEKVTSPHLPFRGVLSTDTSRKLSSCQGKEVILGFRPEQLHPNATSSNPTLQGILEVVEPMGAETYLYLKTGAHSCICRTTETDLGLKEGSKINLGVDLSRAVFFDPKTEETIPT
jgi:multiple sugar transport system ATP-binding protein